MIREMFVRIKFREIPSRHVGMDAIHERRILSHLGRQRTQEMTDALLMFDIDIQIAYHHDTAVCAYALLTARKLTRLHIAFQDVHAILLIEGHARYLIETNHVVLTQKTALAGGIVDKHLGDCCFTAGNQVGIWGNLLEKMAFAGAARS